MQVPDESGSEASWSVVSSEGDLIDSDEYSISSSEPASRHSDRPDLGLATGDEVDEEVDDDRSQDASSEEESEHEDDLSEEDTDMTDVEEIGVEEDNLPNRPIFVCNNQKNENLFSSPNSPGSTFSMDIRAERRVQILVFASVVSAILMGAFFGDIIGIQQLRSYCYSQNVEPLTKSFEEQVFSFGHVYEKPPPWSSPKNRHDSQTKEDEYLFVPREEAEEEEENTDLYQCHRDLDDAIKRSSLNSVLMRYMRSKNSRLNTLIQELQAFVDLQRKEIESLQQQAKGSKATPLQSESVDAVAQLAIDSTPCEEPSRPSRQPGSPPPSFLPDDERPRSEKFETCTPAEQSLFNLTKTFLNNVAKMASNSTALSLLVEGKLGDWIQSQTFTSVPRIIENVRSNWRYKFRSYIQKVSHALTSTSITSLTKPSKRVVGTLKRQIKSVFSRLSQSTWLQTAEDDEVCLSNSTCDLLMEFGSYLTDDKVFRGNLTPKQTDSYVEFLKHIPPRQCTPNSTLVGCERCWWVGKCDGIKKKCNLRRWQRQRQIDPKQFIDGSPKVKEIFKGLGWIDSSELLVVKPSLEEPVGPPRRKPKKMEKTEKKERTDDDWLTRRGAKRAENRRRSSASSWFFERNAQRKMLRRSGRASDWFFDRGSQRAALRHHG